MHHVARRAPRAARAPQLAARVVQLCEPAAVKFKLAIVVQLQVAIVAIATARVRFADPANSSKKLGTLFYDLCPDGDIP